MNILCGETCITFVIPQKSHEDGFIVGNLTQDRPSTTKTVESIDKLDAIDCLDLPYCPTALILCWSGWKVRSEEPSTDGKRVIFKNVSRLPHL